MLNLERAKKKILNLQRYVDLTETYTVNSFETAVIKEYAIYGSVTKVRDKLNESGYRIGERKIESNDVSKIIRSKPTDELHAIVRKFFKNKVRKMPL